MLVLPAPVCMQARKHRLLSGLHVTDAGYFPTAQNHLVERPFGAATTLVILCLHGAGWVKTGGATYKITVGDWVWLPANHPHSYGSAADAEPWTIAWAHFSGDEVPAWRALLGEQNPGEAFVLAMPDDRLDEIALDRVYAALECGYAVRNQVAAATALRHALSAVAQLANIPRDGRSATDRVIASVERLRRDWQRVHHLRELATSAGVSVTHYSALFRHHTGFSPIDYIIRLRMQHASRLLDTTKLSVNEVAEYTGYHDPYYFTRCFRRVMGCSPRKYRNITKG